jgi:hypothetical protein
MYHPLSAVNNLIIAGHSHLHDFVFPPGQKLLKLRPANSVFDSEDMESSRSDYEQRRFALNKERPITPVTGC